MRIPATDCDSRPNLATRTKAQVNGANAHFALRKLPVISLLHPLAGDNVRSTTRYITILGAVLAALAVACAEPTAPRSNALCSGGGTQGWDHCGSDSTSQPVTIVKVALP